MDEIDAAQDRDLEDTARAVAAARARAAIEAASVPVANGYCHNCGDDVVEGMKFCNSDCRFDWDYRRQRGK